MKWLLSFIFLLQIFSVEAASFAADPWATQGCNTTSYQQDPSDRTLFWGRRLIYSGIAGEDAKNECTWKRWGIALYRGDFTRRTLTFLNFALAPITKMADGRTLHTAYDPTVAIIGGVKYVVFECHGVGFSGSVGACLGVVSSNNTINASTVRVVVDGVSSNPAQITSASVPKLTSSSSGKSYLSWTQVVMDKATGKWLKLVSRSILFNPNMARINSDGQAFNTYNPVTSVGVADLFDVKEIQPGKFFFTGSRGENGCLAPLDKQAGCYNVQIGATNGVTEHNAFDNYSQTAYVLPDNPTEYFRWVFNPIKNSWGIFGMTLTKPGTPTARTLPPGLYFIPITNLNTLPVKNVSLCNPMSQPAPHWGAKNGQCLPSCGGIGGTKGSTTSCGSIAMRDMGAAYDAPFCCGPASACNPLTQKSPHWGVKNGKCLPSCGGIGGTRGSTTSCGSISMRDMGASYDAPFCCGPAACNPLTQKSPHWGMKNGQCLPSCGGLGGTRAFTTSCAVNKMKDAGMAFDVPYCCK